MVMDQEIPRCPALLFDAAKYGVKQCGQYCPCWRLVSSDACKEAGSSPYALEVMQVGEAKKGAYAKVCAQRTSPNKWGTKEFSQLSQCL